jgi:glutamyl-tRNA synthetase
MLDDLEARYPPRDLPSGAEVTRLAPSPTGSPHLGTAMQAVVNAALAHGSGGRFVVRIEDTDQTRLEPEAVDDIEAALNWLGEAPDEAPWAEGDYGPYVQSQRLALYRSTADELVRGGHAYPCFCTAERLEAVRERQRAAGEPTRYDRECRDLPAEHASSRRAAGESHVIRMRVPDGDTIVLDDPARGPIEFDSSDVDDSVIVKSDGFPTYHLAVVVDDHFMRITTVIRGEEWISSSPKHLLLYRALGWEPPRFVHTPVLRDEQRRKLSKRRGDTSLFGYFDVQGFLPEALVNFIARLLWPHPKGLDVFPHEDFVRGFDAAALNTAGPIADTKLLLHIDGEHMRALTPLQRFDRACGYLTRLRQASYPVELVTFGRGTDKTSTPLSRGEIEAFDEVFRRSPRYSVNTLGLEPERYKKLGDVVLQGRMFFPETFAPATADEIVAPLGDAAAATALLSAYRGVYRPQDTLGEWERWLRGYAAEHEHKPGPVFLTLRVAITGSRRSPPLHPLMRLLGASEVERRLRVALELVGAGSA